MKRIFPYYNDQFLGKSEFGYSNINSAKKYCNVTREMILNHFGYTNESYKEKFGFVYLIKENNSKYPDPRYIKDMWIYDYNCSSKRSILELSPEVIKEIKELRIFSSINTTKEKAEKIRSFQESTGIFPNIYVDDKEFKKLERKFYKEVINYVEKEITIE